MASRRKKSPGTVFLMLGAAVMLHGGALVAYEMSRPPPPAMVEINVGGFGRGSVLSTPSGLRCPGECKAEFEPGQEIVLVATLGKGTTFEGWSGPCKVNPDYIFECRVTPSRIWTTKVAARFGKVPEEIELGLVQDNEDEESAPAIEIRLPTVDDVDKLAERPPTPIEELIEEEPEKLVAKVEPEKQKPAQQQPKENTSLKSVEVPDANEVDKAPDDARFLSDKNRDVAQETRARETNLDKQVDGQRAFSEANPLDKGQVGASEDKVAENEDSEASDLDTRLTADSSKSGRDEIAKGVVKGESGEAGENGQDGDGASSVRPGVLSMRGIEGRGAPGGPVVPEDKEPDRGRRRGKAGKRGRVGMRTALAWEDFQRLAGKERLDADMHTAERQRSKRRGRFSRKLGAIRSSLENFNSEVREGNQTALKTRAAPFAVYIARMHRRIHKLWGFGYLEELNRRPATDAMNNWTLWTKLEIIILPDGRVEKVNIVRPSGLSMFDVAAIDVVLTGAPYEPTPTKIRSPDQKVYMHWKFHRDWHQCGTFGAQPFILDKPPKPGQGDRGLLGASGNVRVPKVSAAARAQAAKKTAEATARAQAKMPSPDDPRAAFAANLWLTGFTKGDVKKMIKVSGVPFKSRGTVVAANRAALGTVYATIRNENSRRIRQAKLVSAAGYRRLFRTLPNGVEATVADLFFVVRTANSRFTLVLRRQGNAYKVVAFERN